ncbi:unnamed protein product [Linum trigynum]|uniref:CCHC-type domain-containing protein n=1 Tax=Linum trigynum TaxID=586398 RepID=A0AAV2FWE2_9ROSI
MARIAANQVVEFTLEEVQSVKFRTSRTLLGRLFSETNFTPSELREGLVETWRVQGNLRVSVTKYGLFEIVLPSEETRIWILKRTPWIVKDRILHLRSWTPSITRPIFDGLAIAPFRVQLWNVKEDCCTKQFGRKVAAGTIGQVLEADVFTSRETEECFIKVHVLIDFTKPLRSQIKAVSDELGEFWVNFKYEYLPTFCYLCGRVGHAKLECNFAPPLGKERFGPHMSTRKLGRKIYIEEEEYLKFHNASKSVWVNKNAQRREDGAAKTMKPARARDMGERPAPSARYFAQETKPFIGEHDLHDKKETQPRLQEPKQKLTGNGASPKQMVFKASPRVKVGGGVCLHQKKWRRLILQEESEEEELVGVEAAQAKQPLENPRGQLKGSSQVGSVVQRARPRLKKGGAECFRAMLKQDGGSTPHDVPQELVDEEVVPAQNHEGQQQVNDSEDDQSNDEHLPFEIKRRSPGGVSMETPKGLTGRVHRVVEAFEAGLVFAQAEEIPIDGPRSTLNEYGTNLMDPPVENRKRVLEELDGEVGDPPTPKKQFVESSDDLEKVEEASHEWPQGDK